MRRGFQADSDLHISSKRVGEAVLMSLAGHIDELGADALSSALDETFEKGHYRIVLDMGDVRFMGSTGLGQIMRAYRIVGKENGYVRVANPQPLIADVFRLTKLDRLLTIFPTVKAALQSEE